MHHLRSCLAAPAPPGFALPGRRGTSMLEVLIGSVILVLMTIPLSLLMSSSTGNVRRVDLQREVRMMVDQAMQRIEAQDFGTLYDNFGIGPDAPGRIRDGLASTANPLKLDPALLDRLKELKIEASLTFQFLSKADIGVRSDSLRTNSGLLWLQAGVVRLKVWGGGRQGGLLSKLAVDEEVRKTVYCPLILGRPGLLLNQCPAVNGELKKKYLGLGVP